MASQVLSGTTGDEDTPSISYTNNTGQNVRIIINFASLTQTPGTEYNTTILGFSVSCGGMNYGPAPLKTFGKHLTGSVLSSSYSYSPSELAIQSGQSVYRGYMPTELMLPPNGTFNLSGDFELNPPYNPSPSNPSTGRLSYNIVVIPEAG